MFRSFIVMALTFCCTGFAYAQSEVILDIAGITLGMNAAEAQAIAEKRGYEIHPLNGVVKGPTFEEFVEIQKNSGAESSDSVVHRVKLIKTDSRDETINIQFMPMPEGPVMAVVTYTNKTDSLKFDDFLSLAQEKYGEGRATKALRKAVWYDQPLNKNGKAPIDAQKLELTARSSIKLELYDPKAQLSFMTAVKEAKEAEAKKHKPTF